MTVTTRVTVSTSLHEAKNSPRKFLMLREGLTGPQMRRRFLLETMAKRTEQDEVLRRNSVSIGVLFGKVQLEQRKSQQWSPKVDMIYTPLWLTF